MRVCTAALFYASGAPEFRSKIDEHGGLWNETLRLNGVHHSRFHQLAKDRAHREPAPAAVNLDLEGEVRADSGSPVNCTY
jgi:hypothetical protein